MARKIYRVFYQGVIGFIVCFILGLYGYLTAEKKRDELSKATGAIIMLKKHYNNDVNENHSDKMRFLQIAGNSRVFALFVGKNKDDFSPEIDKIDELNLGDIVTIYYQDKVRDDLVINRNAEYIDKGNIIYFINSNATKYFLLGIMYTGLFGLVMLVFLKRGKYII